MDGVPCLHRNHQAHRQPIKTPGSDSRHQPHQQQQQGQAHHPYARGGSTATGHRSAPVTPRDGSPVPAAFGPAPQHQHQQHHHQQQQQQQPQQQHPSHMPMSAAPGASSSYNRAPGQQHARGMASTTAAAARSAQSTAKPAAVLTPDQAATIIQTAWRCARLARQRPAMRELAKAASQLRSITAREAQILAGQPGQPLTQKQFLELSESVMKVLFALDATSCGVPELRAKRKELTTAANKLLDELQAAHKAAPAAAAGGAAGQAAVAAGSGSGSAGRQQQQHVMDQAPGQKQQGRRWFRR